MKYGVGLLALVLIALAFPQVQRAVGLISSQTDEAAVIQAANQTTQGSDQVGMAAAKLVSKGTSKITPTKTANGQTSILDTMFNLQVTANTAPIVFGLGSSTVPLVSANSFAVYKNGVDTSSTTGTVTVDPSFDVADYGVTIDQAARKVTVPVGSSAYVLVHAKITVTGPVSNNMYSIQIKKLTWGNANYTFMANLPAWRSDPVQMP